MKLNPKRFWNILEVIGEIDLLFGNISTEFGVFESSLQNIRHFLFQTLF